MAEKGCIGNEWVNSILDTIITKGEEILERASENI